MKKTNTSFLSSRLGASYAISAVIMTVTTITLVLIVSTYAYQVLEQREEQLGSKFQRSQF